jgi:hypothetical protein
MVSEPGALPAAPAPGARRCGRGDRPPTADHVLVEQVADRCGERVHEPGNGHVANSSIAISTCT